MGDEQAYAGSSCPCDAATSKINDPLLHISATTTPGYNTERHEALKGSHARNPNRDS